MLRCLLPLSHRRRARLCACLALLMPAPSLFADAACTCSDDCNSLEVGATKGICDDGGTGARTSICKLGTDASDCGCSGNRCLGYAPVSNRGHILSPTPTTAALSNSMGMQRGALMAARRDVDLHRGRQLQVCCTELLVQLGGDGVMMFVSSGRMLSGAPVYERVQERAASHAATLYPTLTTLFRWSGGSCAQFGLDPPLPCRPRSVPLSVLLALRMNHIIDSRLHRGRVAFGSPPRWRRRSLCRLFLLRMPAM